MAYLGNDPGYSPTITPSSGNGPNSGVPTALPPENGLTVNLPLSKVNPYVADVTRTDQARLGLVDRFATQRIDGRGVGNQYGVFARGGDSWRPGSRGESDAGFNFAMWDMVQNIDPLIEKKLIANPRFWHDRIPRGQFQLHNGAVQQSRIFRGGLQKYAGLDEWEAIDPVPSLTNDPCKFPRHGTYTYGWDQLAWSGMRAAWGSDPICANAFRYVKDAAQQLALILEVGMERGVQMQETFNRDTYLSKATDFGRSFVMTSAFHHYNDSPRYYYDPFVKFGAVASSATKTADINLVSKAFIVIDASAEIEPINWSLLDRIHELLKLRCPDAALGYDAGEPLFGLMVNSEDVDKSIEGDEKVYREWLEAKPLALIQKYNLSPKVYRRWAIVSDANQIRFKIKRYVAEYSSESYGGVAKDLDGKPVYIAEAVDPFVADPDRQGINGGPLPIENVDYVDAELAIAPVFMNDVLTNLFEAGGVNLGSGTHFGAYPSLNGQWGWVLSPQSEQDPFQQTGKFYGLFAIHQKPEPRIRDVISFLYRRCKETIRARCPIESKRVNPDAESTIKTVDRTVTLQAKVEVSGSTVTLPTGTVIDVVMGKGAAPAFIGETRTLETDGFSGGVAVKVVDVTSFPYVSVALTTGVTATAAGDSDSDSDSFPESYSGDLTELFTLKEGSIPAGGGLAVLEGKALTGGQLV